jgi:outer membrane autotransporter protein
MNARNSIGAFAYTGGQLSLTNCIVTQEDSNGIGFGIATQDDTRDPQTPNPTILKATDTVISVTGDGNDIVAAYFAGATTTLDHSTVTGTGSNNFGLVAYFGGVIKVLNQSTVTSTGSDGALVDSGSVLNVVGSTIHGDVNGILIKDDIHTLGSDTVTLTNSKLMNLAGNNGEAAFKVVGADVNIAVTDSTVDSGVGATQHTLLDVTQSVPSQARITPVNPTPAVTQAANHPSVVNLTADHSTLNGDILVDATSIANINLIDNSSLQGIINGANDVLVGDPSVWTTPNNSMLVGNLALQSGTLVVNSTAKFASSGQASVVTIGGNFSMDSASTLSLGIGGLNGSQYDHLLVGKNAEVAGTLNVSSLGGFHPANLNLFEIIRSGTTTSGAQFATVNDGINNNPNLQRVDIYAPNGVALLYVAVTPPPAPTPTPRPIIDVIPTPLPPIEPNRPLSLSFLLAVLNPTVEQLTSMFEIPFSGANTQRFNLNDRMTQIQRGSTGFVSPISPVSPPAPTGKDIGKKEVIPPVFTPGPTNRWGVWVNGWGDWVSVDSDNSIKGYDFTTGGVSVGLDYRITNCLAVGIFGTYAHTWTSLNPGDVDVDTGRGGAYATYWNQGFYVNGGIYGGYNSYDTSRQTLLRGRLANGNTSGYEFSTFVDTGYDFHFGNLSFGPVFAAQYTNVHFDSYTEQGAFLPLNIHDDSEESWRTDLGIQASYAWHVGNIIVIPSLWVAWDHEYKYNRLPVTFSSVDFPGVSATTFGPHEGHDSAIINAGVGTQWTPRISTYLGYQGQLGRDNYSANGVTGTISFSF